MLGVCHGPQLPRYTEGALYYGVEEGMIYAGILPLTFATLPPTSDSTETTG